MNEQTHTVTPIHQATADELPAVARFRYHAMSSDAGFRPCESMREAQALTDEWDSLSVVLVAGEPTDIQGTFRVVPLGRVAARFGMDSAMRSLNHLGLERALRSFAIDEICVVGRLAVAPNLRGTRTVIDLLAQALYGCRVRGERLALADCSPPLVRLYERLAGFFRSGPNFVDPIYGLKSAIMGALGDHQQSARAAIGYVTRQFPDDPAARCFREQVQADDDAAGLRLALDAASAQAVPPAPVVRALDAPFPVEHPQPHP